MKSLSCVLVLVILCTPLAIGQEGKIRSRKMDRYNRMQTPHEPTPKVTVTVDPERLKHDSDELLSLVQSIPYDIDQVSKGLSPKDNVKDKLKRIEELSKHLRKEIP